MKGIVIAMQGEFDFILKKAFSECIKITEKPYTVFICADNKFEPYVVIVSRPGKINAASAAQYLVDYYHVTKLINIGVCGATLEAFKYSPVAIIDSVVNSDFDTSAIDGDNFVVPSLGLNNPQMDIRHFNKLYTADHFTLTKPKIDGKEVEGYFDMEGYSVAEVAKKNNIDCLIIKSATDIIDTDNQDDQYNCNYDSACAKALEKFIEVELNS